MLNCAKIVGNIIPAIFIQPIYFVGPFVLDDQQQTQFVTDRDPCMTREKNYKALEVVRNSRSGLAAKQQHTLQNIMYDLL